MARPLSFSLGLLIVTLTLGAAGWTFAQSPQAPTATIISGTDIGFRVDEQSTKRIGKLTGTWVVRVNGQWVEPEPLRMSRPLSTP